MQLYAYIPRNANAALLCPKAICSMLRRNSRSDIAIIFWATPFSLVCVDHVGAQRQRCALKLVRCLGTWVRFFKNCFSRKKLLETSPKVSILIPKHYGVISEHYSVISQHYGVISRLHNDRIPFPQFLLLMDLQSPYGERSLFRSGYWDHLFVSQAYAWWAIVPQPSQPLTLGNVIFACPSSKFPGYVKKTPRVCVCGWESGIFLYATPI